MNAWQWRQNWRGPAEQITSRLTHSIEASRSSGAVQTSIDRWSNGIQGALTHPIADWFQAHPLFAWGADHPLLALGLLLVVLLLLSGLLQAIARFTEQIWIWILRSPVLLIQWLIVIGRRWLRRKPAAGSIATSKQQRLTAVLQKLETMRQEQEELLQEVRALLADESIQP